MYRTHFCNDLRKNNAGEEVKLCGFIHRIRDLGDTVFLQLRDRYGKTQCVWNTSSSVSKEEIQKLRHEFVVQITGKVQVRSEEHQRKEELTGDIEVEITELTIFSESQTPPFEINTEKEVSQDIRFEYRYLDLRRESLLKNLELRAKIASDIRAFYESERFLEVETPCLIKGTPEGSREYIVPSRIYPGNFFVLPQSPQQLKQLCMVGGIDRYYQFAKCFRDEDLRGDRQPEFTQVDIEMSFTSQEEIMDLHEKLLLFLHEKHASHKKLLHKIFPRISFYEAMSKYGSDKPDIRFGYELHSVTSLFGSSGFSVFDTVKNTGGEIFALPVPFLFTRKEIDALEEKAKQKGAKGLAFCSIQEGVFSGGISKFLSDEVKQKLREELSLEEGNTVFFGAGEFLKAVSPLGEVRLEIGKTKNCIPENVFAFLWVYDFPAFEKNDEGEVSSVHHPFTSMHEEDLFQYKDTDLTKIRSYAYDVVLNGVELGGGSIRIHDDKIQRQVFDILGISEEDQELRFGHMLKAFSYGVPPHGGLAFGFDRLVSLFADETNITEVIAFPKTLKTNDLMLKAPSPVSDEVLAELKISLKN
jgi:aspartyl-tRNA synthetase